MSLTCRYQGQGEPHTAAATDLPVVDPSAMTRPDGYRAGPALVAAVDVAITLGMPLLLTGEPGIGKSRLAHSIAWELRLGEEPNHEPLVFRVKSDTQGRDLFYSFDTLGRFHAAQTKDADADPRRFLSFNALGKALLLAKHVDVHKERLGPAWDGLGHPGEPRKLVVLIDEIDKAPRDVPNDILTEIEEMEFRIPEISALPEVQSHPDRDNFQLISKQERSQGEKTNPYRPIVIITSNSEKGLPDAFLRRCVYLHLSLPPFADQAKGNEVTVEKIVEERLGRRYQNGSENLVQDAIALFRHLRNQSLTYKPSLAELLNWLDYLLPDRVGGAPLGRLKDIKSDIRNAGIRLTLLKNEAAQRDAQQVIEAWFKA